VRTIGAVAYLNALPLTHGLEAQPGVEVRRHVPSALLAELESGRVDLALCPVVDFQRSAADLVIIPEGAIGVRSRALTVRLFARCPPAAVRRVAADTDSHSSVALLQILLSRLGGRLVDVEPLADPTRIEEAVDVDAALLIGDKVVTMAPSTAAFPHQLDLGRAWRDLTGLPFVFAAWMADAGTELGPLPQALAEVKRRNMAGIERLAPAWAASRGWPADLALTYVRDVIDYELGDLQVEAMRLFWSECSRLGLIDAVRPLRLSPNRS
jgi:chorismate dehydratase